MRRRARFLVVGLLAVMAAVLLAAGQTMTPAVMLTAATYIVKGTNSAFNQIPDSAYPAFAQKYDSAVNVATPQPIILVQYPAALWPITPPGYLLSPTFDQSVATGVQNLENPATGRPLNSTSTGDVLWGYSQGATVVTQYKRDWNAAYPTDSAAVPPTFVLVANPNRPNGGILERGTALGTIPVFGLTFSGATPTTTAGQPGGTVTTYDIARQYDGIADAPVNPLNPIADLNAAMGFYYLHGQYPNADPATAIYQGQYQDTNYYLIPTYPLPLLMPLDSIPVVGFALADTLDPALRVIVESAYDRSTPPGVPTPFNPLYFPNPATFGTDLLLAIPTGLDNGISDFTGTRPLGTTRPGPYGVGGPATIGINGQPTPPPSTPTTGTSPTIPLLASSGGGVPGLPVPSSPGTTSLVASPLQLSAPSGVNQSLQGNTTVGRRLNVVRPSLGVQGSAQPDLSSTNASHSTNNPIGAAVASVTNTVSSAADSIGSTLGGSSAATKAGTK